MQNRKDRKRDRGLQSRSRFLSGLAFRHRDRHRVWNRMFLKECDRTGSGIEIYSKFLLELGLELELESESESACSNEIRHGPMIFLV